MDLGAWTNQDGSSHASPVKTLEVFPESLEDWYGYLSSYATSGVPGVTVDSTGAASYDGGGALGVTGAPGVPLVHLADGDSGNINSFVHLNASGTLHMEDDSEDTAKVIRAAIADLTTAGYTWTTDPVTFYELPVCIDNVTYYVQVLCSKKYATAVGNSA